MLSKLRFPNRRPRVLFLLQKQLLKPSFCYKTATLFPLILWTHEITATPNEDKKQDPING
jgi:hypothetical protein